VSGSSLAQAFVTDSKSIAAGDHRLTAYSNQVSSTAETVRFRRFHVVPSERRLLCDGRPVEIGGRAFDLLLILLNSRGMLVTKDEIVNYVWPSTVVDESNLRFQMASLRKALGEDRDVIKTIPRRGYLFATESAQAQPFERGGQRDAGRGGLVESGVESPLIAVIDDDDATREALHGLLRSVGWRVETFASVQTFLNAVPKCTPHCLILDVWMPGRSGLDFQTDLVSVGLNVPVIFISGQADVPMSVRAMKAGAIEFLTKPVRHEELLAAISLAVGSRVHCP
jgi:DNA-binding response OmpR family regulator